MVFVGQLRTGKLGRKVPGLVRSLEETKIMRKHSIVPREYYVED
jgi:hypothetical protein